MRTLKEDEFLAGASVVAIGMLGSLEEDGLKQWTEHWDGPSTHGAFTEDESLVGIARWFPADLCVPGAAVPAACVTAVAVKSTHKRQGHLTRLMDAQLASIADDGRPVALLLAAEWPIYGRFGYGPAAPACGYRIDTRSARFLAAPTGTVELVDLETLRPILEEVHDRRWARTPAAVTREPYIWDRLAGLKPWPGSPDTKGMRRGAIWRDESGEIRGAVAYKVNEVWTDNRPTGKAEVTLLVGETPEAERELWRHLCEIDWVVTVEAEARGLDDPLPLFLADARAAVQVDVSDCIWARVLDLPAVFSLRRPALAGRVVIDVDDPQGYIDGRWALDLGPDHGEVAPTDEPADVAVPAHALGAMTFGGMAAARLLEAGWIAELQPGGIARLDALLHSPVTPWSPTTY